MNPQIEYGARHCRRASRSKRKLALAAVAFLLSASTAFGQDFGPWSEPVSVDPDRTGLNTAVNDGCPIEAPDGNALFFASDRPDGSGLTNLNIWVAYRTSEDGPWDSVERLPSPVNLAVSNEFCPTPLPGNRLLFVSTRPNPNGCGGRADIYVTRLHPVHGWLPPVPLNCDINSAGDEWSPSFVEADGVTALFFSSDRVQLGQHKIQSSVLQPDGSWSPAAPVAELNISGASDARPNVRKDGLEIVFDSTRPQSPAPPSLPSQIYTATRSSVFEPWSAPVTIDAVNLSTRAQNRASISRDGTRLYFGSNRANVAGDTGADIFVSTRSGPGSR